VEELILFIIFLVFSFLRSLPEGRKAAPPGHPMPPVRPRQVLPQPWEALHVPAGDAHPTPIRRITPEDPESTRPQAARPAAVEDETEGDAFFQMDRDTVLLGLVFSEILREPRSRHRRVRPFDFYR
jgi:hypothetical protein